MRPQGSGEGTLGLVLEQGLSRVLSCHPPPPSQQPVPEQLRIQVSRVSMHDYEALHYDKEQLKEACEWHAGLRGH